MVFPYALKKLVHFSRKRKKETLSSEVEDLDRRFQRKAEASTTTKKDSSIDDSKPLVKCGIHGLTFNALLDACSIPVEYIPLEFFHWNLLFPLFLRLVQDKTLSANAVISFEDKFAVKAYFSKSLDSCGYLSLLIMTLLTHLEI